jgi:hypothetical protein
MTSADFRARLQALDACPEALEWLGERTLEQAWTECERGDWLLWLAARAGVDGELLVTAACDCAETALRHVPAGEKRPAEAIRVARAWVRGEATLDTVRSAHAAAYVAYVAAADAARVAISAAAYADSSSADAYDAACAADYAAVTAADAARAAARAAAARVATNTAAAVAAAEEACAASLRESARLMRAAIPLEAVRAGLEAKP